MSHLKLFLKNKNIVLLTIPTILFSCFDIFEGLLLGQYLLRIKMFSISELVTFWSIISGITLIMQYPLGALSDNKRTLLFIVSTFMLICEFAGLIFTSNIIFLHLFGIILYIGALGYSMGMSVLFGNMTTKQNRLSESEVYRMLRLIGSAFFSTFITIVFNNNEKIALIIIMLLIVFAATYTMICNLKMTDIES